MNEIVIVLEVACPIDEHRSDVQIADGWVLACELVDDVKAGDFRRTVRVVTPPEPPGDHHYGHVIGRYKDDRLYCYKHREWEIVDSRPFARPAPHDDLTVPTERNEP